jgi:hypothetical protein
MHWLLVISAVIVSWLAIGVITMNAVLWLHRRGKFPILGPYTALVVAYLVEADAALDILCSSARENRSER